MSFEEERFRAVLEETHEWPTMYTFKFIVPSDKVDKIKKILKSDEVITRPSKKGNYLSLTCTKNMKSSDEIITIYRKVSDIKGIISL